MWEIALVKSESSEGRNRRGACSSSGGRRRRRDKSVLDMLIPITSEKNCGEKTLGLRR